MAPTFVSYQDSADWATARGNGTVYTISSVSVQTGDLLLVFGGVGNGSRELSTPSGGSLTYTLQSKPNADNDTSHADAFLWTATATSTTSFNITSTLTDAGTSRNGITVWVWRDAVLGAVAGIEDSGTAPSLAITTTADNSAVGGWYADWSAVDGTTRTWRTINSITPTAGNGFEKLYADAGGNFKGYNAYWNDVGTAGTKTTGLSAPTGQVANSIAVEIQAAEPPPPPPPLTAGPIVSVVRSNLRMG